MLEHSVYSVASPEGCAAIVWRDASYAPQAAEAMRVTAQELRELGLVDGIVPEPAGGAHKDYSGTFAAIGEMLERELAALVDQPVSDLPKRRREKYRRMGPIADPVVEP